MRRSLIFASGLEVVESDSSGLIEMSYGSELDLVLVHQADADALTDGSQSIEGGLFINRAVRRMVSISETTTRFGKLYEIFTRL